MLWSSKKNKPGYSYFASDVALEGRMFFQGAIRLDGSFKGTVLSPGRLEAEKTSVIKGDICVETIILSGTVYGNIRASKQVQLNATAKVFGDIHYGEISIEPGAVHEGTSHKLTQEEISDVKAECAAMEENSAKLLDGPTATVVASLPEPPKTQQPDYNWATEETLLSDPPQKKAAGK